jgi:hypothetical protein
VGVSRIALSQNDRAHGHIAEQSIQQSGVLVLDPPNDRVEKAIIQVLDLDVVYRDDGGSPTPTHGIIIQAGDILVYEADRSVMELFTVRTVAGAGTARLRVAFYGY